MVGGVQTGVEWRRFVALTGTAAATTAADRVVAVRPGPRLLLYDPPLLLVVGVVERTGTGTTREGTGTARTGTAGAVAVAVATV